MTRRLIRRPQERVLVPGAQPGRVNLSAEQTSVRIGEIVKFTVISDDVSGPELRLDYGDGKYSVIPAGHAETNHRFQQPGSFRVTVRLQPDVGTMAMAAVPISLDSLTMRVDSVALDAIPGEVEVGRRVTFRSLFNPSGQQVRYRYSFGDDTPLTAWTESPETTHAYRTSGIFSAYVEIGIAVEPSTTRLLTRSALRNVTVVEGSSAAVLLDVRPREARTDEVLTFRASTEEYIPGLIYRFSFGDGQRSAWTTSNVVTHAYSSPGNFTASVEAREGERPLIAGMTELVIHPPTMVKPVRPRGRSDPVERPPPPSPPPARTLTYVIAAVVLAALGYGARKLLFDSHPKLRIVPDRVRAHVEDQKCLELLVKITLKPNLEAGEFSIYVRDGNLIRKKER